MSCYQCGSAAGTSSRLCPECTEARLERRATMRAPEREEDIADDTDHPHAKRKAYELAAPGWRLVALSCDIVAITVIGTVAVIWVFRAIGYTFQLGGLLSAGGTPSEQTMMEIGQIIAVCGPIFILTLYGAVFEGSDLRATPGKLLLGLAVCDAGRRKISFSSAILRNAFKWFPALMGPFIILCTESIIRKYPFIPVRLVLPTLAFLLIANAGYYLANLYRTIVTTKGQGWHDEYARAIVYQDEDVSFFRRGLVAFFVFFAWFLFFLWVGVSVRQAMPQ